MENKLDTCMGEALAEMKAKEAISRYKTMNYHLAILALDSFLPRLKASYWGHWEKFYKNQLKSKEMTHMFL